MFPSVLAQTVTKEVEEAVRWLQMPPAWVVALVIAPLVLLFVAYFYRRERPTGSVAWKWLLSGLRVTVICFAILMLFQPVRRLTIYEMRDSTILVLVDDSLSMDIPDRFSNRKIPEKLAELLRSSVERVEETTRYELVRRLLADTEIGLLDGLRDKAKVIVSTFAKSTQEIARLPRSREDTAGVVEAQAEPEKSSGLLPAYEAVRNSARVQETRIAENLRDVVASALGSRFGNKEEKVTGVLIFTDGQENAGTASIVEVGRRLGQRETPVYVVGVGNPDEPKDVRLTNVDVKDVVLIDDRVSFDVTVVGEGFEGRRVRMQLKVDSLPVDTKYFMLEGDGQPQAVRLLHRPRKAGEFTATVEVEKLGGEVFHDNNSISKSIRVLDQKIKVLYVENLPRWEYRYLQHALTRDPTMEAQIYLLSADLGFIQEHSKHSSPLTALPRDRETLFAYHAIVLGDVDARDLGEETTKLLKDFVFEGGGLVFLSGPQANPWSYLHSDLYGLLPVEVPETGGFTRNTRGPITSSFNVKLSPVGTVDPVMRLDNDPERNVRLWENDDGQFYEHLPGFFWFAEVGPKKPQAVVLARHPERLHPIYKKGLVIFAYMKYGNGNTFFSAVDETWRWRAGVENLYLGRFWGQVVRFVASGRLLGKTQRYKVSTDKAVYNLGETVEIDCRVLDASMNPSSERTVTVYHQVQGQEDEPPEKVELSLSERRGPGTYRGSIAAGQRGRHDLWLPTESERLAFRSFTVEVPALESRDPRLNRVFLQRLAARSGGEYVGLEDVLQVADRLKGVSRSEEGQVEDDDLWDEWWIVVLFTALIALEWVLRKGVRLL